MSAPRNDCSQERFPILQPTLQIGFHARLSEARSETLLPALLEFVSTADIECIDSELREFAGPDKLKMVAGSGLRGELVYPVALRPPRPPRASGVLQVAPRFLTEGILQQGTVRVFRDDGEPWAVVLICS